MQINNAPSMQNQEEAWHALTPEDVLKNLEAHDNNLMYQKQLPAVCPTGRQSLQVRYHKESQFTKEVRNIFYTYDAC